jgi:hypothetical protein
MQKRIAAIYEAISQTVAAAWAPLLVAAVVVVGIARR